MALSIIAWTSVMPSSGATAVASPRATQYTSVGSTTSGTGQKLREAGCAVPDGSGWTGAAVCRSLGMPVQSQDRSSPLRPDARAGSAGGEHDDRTEHGREHAHR